MTEITILHRNTHELMDNPDHDYHREWSVHGTGCKDISEEKRNIKIDLEVTCASFKEAATADEDGAISDQVPFDLAQSYVQDDVYVHHFCILALGYLPDEF